MSLEPLPTEWFRDSIIIPFTMHRYLLCHLFAIYKLITAAGPRRFTFFYDFSLTAGIIIAHTQVPGTSYVAYSTQRFHLQCSCCRRARRGFPRENSRAPAWHPLWAPVGAHDIPRGIPREPTVTHELPRVIFHGRRLK